MRRTGTGAAAATPRPTVSATVTRYLIASFEVRMPPAGFTPIFSPVSAVPVAHDLAA